MSTPSQRSARCLITASSQPFRIGQFLASNSWTPLKGSYIFPLKVFGDDRPPLAADYLEVLSVRDANGVDVAITRGGGLFVRPDPDLELVDSSYARQVAATLNFVLCELSVQGMVSHAVTETDVQDGRLLGHHATILGGWGNHGERTWGPVSLLVSQPGDLNEGFGLPANPYWPPNFYWTPNFDLDILDRIDGFSNASKLLRYGAMLPTLLVSAAFHASRYNISETVLSSWIVCEALVSARWDEYVMELAPERKKRLNDTRTYSASVRLEVLRTVGALDDECYTLLHQARAARNDLAHNVRVTVEKAAVCVSAMRLFLSRFDIETERMPGFIFSGGGSGPPQEIVHPQFPFRVARYS